MKSFWTLGSVAFALSAPLASHAVSVSTTQTYHFDSGTSLSTASFGSFSGQSGSLDFQFLPSPGAPASNLTISNIQIQGPWKITAADGSSAVTAATAKGVTFQGALQTYFNLLGDTNSSHLNDDLSPLSLIVPNYAPGGVPSSDFSLPITSFGDSFSFDISETGPVLPAVGSDFIVKAIDDPLTLATLHFTPGSSQTVLLNSAPGVSLLGTNGTPSPTAPVPEFTTSASLGLMLLGFACVTLRARRRPVR